MKTKRGLYLWLLMLGLFLIPEKIRAAEFGAMEEFTEALEFRLGGYQNGNWVRKDLLYSGTDVNGNLYTVNVKDTTMKILTFQETGAVSNVRTIRLPLPIFGGYYHGSDGNHYVAVGQDNPSESRELIVCKILKYSPDWNLLGTADIPGGMYNVFTGIYEPFECSQTKMTLHGQYLVCYTARTMFVHEDGLHHQSDITFVVDTTTMALKESYPQPYDSHSFAQYVKSDGTNAYFLSHGDAYPRAVQLYMYTTYLGEGSTERELNLFSLLGDTGDNYTGTTVNGFEIGNGGQILTGKSVPHNQMMNGITGYQNVPKNIYVITANAAAGSARFQWLTDYTMTDVEVTEPRMIKISEDRFVILFNETRSGIRVLRYFLLDSAGNVLTKRNYTGMNWSGNSDILYRGGRLMWIAQTEQGFCWEYIPYRENSAGLESAGEQTIYLTAAQNQETLPRVAYDPEQGEDIRFAVTNGESFEIFDGKLFFRGSGAGDASLEFYQGNAKLTFPVKSFALENMILQEGETKNVLLPGTETVAKTYTSDRPETASVDGNGLVTALHEGITTIRVQIGGKSLNCRVYVQSIQPPEITGSAVQMKRMIETELGSVLKLTVAGTVLCYEFDFSARPQAENYMENGRAMVWVDAEANYADCRNRRISGEIDFSSGNYAEGELWFEIWPEITDGWFTGMIQRRICWQNGKLSIPEQVELTDVKMVFPAIADQSYTGKELKPECVPSYAGAALKKGRDYTVRYENNTSAGEGKMIFSGIGGFTGGKTVKFRILKKEPAPSKMPGKVKNLRTYKNSATAVYLKWSRLSGAERYVLYGRPYGKGSYIKIRTVSGIKSSDRISLLKKGVKIKPGTAYQMQIAAQKKVSGKWVTGPKSTLTVVTNPNTPKITGLTAGKGSLKLRWKRISGVSGYQVYLSRRSSSGYKCVSTLRKSTYVTKTVKGLKSGTTYYVKMRSFKKAAGKTAYSSFTKVKKIRTK